MKILKNNFSGPHGIRRDILDISKHPKIKDIKKFTYTYVYNFGPETSGIINSVFEALNIDYIRDI